MKKCSFLSIMILLSFLTLIPVHQYQKPTLFADGLLSSSNSSWNRTYTNNPGSFQPWFYDIAEYDDDGFVIVGRASSNIWVLRANTVGDVLVNETCGGHGGTSVDVCDDDSLVVTDIIGAVMIKVSSSGAQVWNSTFATDLTASDVVVCDNGGYAICGRKIDYALTDQMLLLKMDSSGEEQWRRYFGDGAWGYSHYSAYCIVECTGGGFFLIGYAMNMDNSDADVYVVRADSEGDTIWNKTLDLEEDMNTDRGVSGVECSDGGFVVVTKSAHVIRFDSSGEVLWTEDYAEEPLLSQYPYIKAGSVIQCSSGGYCISGRAFNSSDEAAFLIRMDANGDTQWVRTFSGWPNRYPSVLSPARVIERSSGGFALACTIVEPSSVWLIVTPDADTTTSTDTTTTDTTTTDASTTTTTTTPTTTTPSTDLGDTMILVAVGGGAVLFIVIVVLFKKRGT